MVSAEPCIILDALPIKLSGPFVDKIFSKTDKEPLPDSGRKSASGTISLGICKKSVTGLKKEMIISKAPDALNIPIATIKAISDGNMFIEVCIPCLAPVVKAEKTSTFLKSAYIIIIQMLAGRIKFENQIMLYLLLREYVVADFC